MQENPGRIKNMINSSLNSLTAESLLSLPVNHEKFCIKRNFIKRVKLTLSLIDQLFLITSMKNFFTQKKLSLYLIKSFIENYKF